MILHNHKSQMLDNIMDLSLKYLTTAIPIYTGHDQSETIYNYIRTHNVNHITLSNIVSYVAGRAYFPPRELSSFLSNLDIARRNGSKISVYEKQNMEGSGIFLDIDVCQPLDQTKHQYSQLFFQKLIHRIFKIIHKIFDIRQYPEDTVIVGITHKKSITIYQPPGAITGFHIIIPGFKLSRNMKEVLIETIIQKQIIDNTFKELKITTISPPMLDRASAYTLVPFVGCCANPDKLPHELMSAFNVNVNTLGVSPNRIITSSNFNIVGEFSINYETDMRIIKKVSIDYKPSW